MKIRLLLTAPLVLTLIQCTPRRYNASQSSSATCSDKTFMSIADFLAPETGAWTGRLILPEQHWPDGGVDMEVYTAPHGITAPRQLRVVFDRSDKWIAEYMERTITSVDFKKAGGLVESLLKNHVVLPYRLNGRPNVSPLESLAGYRPKDHETLIHGQPTPDSMEVFIKEASLVNGELKIRSEPVQITGKEVALIKFNAPAGDQRYSVTHWNCGTRDFNGKDATFSFIKSSTVIPGTTTTSDLTGIEKSGSNSGSKAGWYAYGEHIGNEFQIRALEPRRLMSVTPDAVLADNFEGFVRNGNFQQERQRKGRASTTLIPGAVDKGLKLGTRGLIIHTFGGIAGKDGDGETRIPVIDKLFVSGHFAFGIGEVVKDPFTGEPKLDIEYKQVYATNPNAIVGGSLKWHTYAGSLERGWMETRPIADAFIVHPSLSQPYNIDGEIFDPLRDIGRELDVMAARYRTGDGRGPVEVGTTTSCAQDSNQAMYVGTMRFLDWKNTSPKLASFLKSNPNSADTKRFRDLEKIMDEYRGGFLRFALLRADWQAAAKAQFAIERPEISKVEEFLRAVAARKTAVPRFAFDDLTSLMLKHGSLVWMVRTDQVGGERPDICPLAPGIEEPGGCR